MMTVVRSGQVPETAGTKDPCRLHPRQPVGVQVARKSQTAGTPGLGVTAVNVGDGEGKLVDEVSSWRPGLRPPVS